LAGEVQHSANEVCAVAAMYQGRNAQNTSVLQSAACFVLIAHQIKPRCGKTFLLFMRGTRSI
jgi:hypothetical protein